MSYSNAFVSNSAHTRELNMLLQEAKEASESLEVGDRMSPQELKLRQLAVSLIAVLQAYVSDLLTERCEVMADSWDDLTPIQQRYIAAHVHRHLSKLLLEIEEGELIEPRKCAALTRRVRDVSEWSITPRSFVRRENKLDLQGFLGDNGTKSLSKALSLHRPDGMEFLDWLRAQPAYRASVERLDNLIRLRNDVAHGRFERRITLREAREYRSLINRLFARIDKYVLES